MISVAPSDKKDNNNRNQVDSSFIIKHNENESRDVIAYILRQYHDYSVDAQYDAFMAISKINIDKLEFLKLRKEVNQDIKTKFQNQTALMEYHVDHVMAREHTNIIDFLIKKLRFYIDKWEKMAYVQNPDLNKLEQLDRMIHSTARILSEFNLGTNVILFIQKKMELLGNKSNIINIDDLNIYNSKYNNKSPNAESEISTSTEEKLRGKDGGSLPKLKSDIREYAQGGNDESSETRPRGSSEEDNRRTREDIF